MLCFLAPVMLCDVLAYGDRNVISHQRAIIWFYCFVLCSVLAQVAPDFDVTLIWPLPRPSLAMKWIWPWPNFSLAVLWDLIMTCDCLCPCPNLWSINTCMVEKVHMLLIGNYYLGWIMLAIIFINLFRMHPPRICQTIPPILKATKKWYTRNYFEWGSL